jgi:4-diphosphocytidyl-2-C-methyl-D-erythritol kinase
MIVFPNCKINIGLYITAKRQDGFHDVQTIFYPIKNFYDSLEIVEASEFSCTTTGIDLTIANEDNIVVKAFRLLQSQYNLPNIAIALHKYIPHGAGLGGGSADAAFMLQLCNSYFNLQLSTENLLQLSASLGSDCAFFIHNTPCIGLGRGEVLQPIALDLSSYFICIIKPKIYISTADAFKHITPQQPGISLQDAIQQPIQFWQQTITNQFEEGIFAQHPTLASIKQQLINEGASYAAMSGTGSTIYGIFDAKKIIEIPNATTYWFAL